MKKQKGKKKKAKKNEMKKAKKKRKITSYWDAVSDAIEQFHIYFDKCNSKIIRGHLNPKERYALFDVMQVGSEGVDVPLIDGHFFAELHKQARKCKFDDTAVIINAGAGVYDLFYDFFERHYRPFLKYSKAKKDWHFEVKPIDKPVIINRSEVQRRLNKWSRLAVQLAEYQKHMVIYFHYLNKHSCDGDCKLCSDGVDAKKCDRKEVARWKNEIITGNYYLLEFLEAAFHNEYCKHSRGEICKEFEENDDDSWIDEAIAVKEDDDSDLENIDDDDEDDESWIDDAVKDDEDEDNDLKRLCKRDSEYDVTEFIIRFNNCGTKFPCPICGDDFKALIGPELFFGKRPVCPLCAEKRVPGLVKMLEIFRGYRLPLGDWSLEFFNFENKKK